MLPLRLCGGKLLVAVTGERRYGPSRLRVNDDDDDDLITRAAKLNYSANACFTTEVQLNRNIFHQSIS